MFNFLFYCESFQKHSLSQIVDSERKCSRLENSIFVQLVTEILKWNCSMEHFSFMKLQMSGSNSNSMQFKTIQV